MSRAVSLAIAAAVALASCRREPAPSPPPRPAPPTLLDVCRDAVDEPLDVACLVGRAAGDAMTCDARPVMGCPSLRPPGFALLGCAVEPDEAPPVGTFGWVRWSAGELTAVPSSRAAPNTVLEGAQRNESLPRTAVMARFDELVARARVLGCDLSGVDRARWVSTAFGRCGSLELEIRGREGVGADGVTVLVARPEVHDCVWAGKHGGTGTRPRGATSPSSRPPPAP